MSLFFLYGQFCFFTKFFYDMIAFYIFSMIFSPQNMMKLGLLLILLPAYAFADIGTSGIDI